MKKVIWVLKIANVLAGLAMLVGWMVAPEYWHKPLSYIATVLIPFAPDVLRLFKISLSDQLVIAYEAFLIVAMVVGIDLDWYALVMVTENGSYFDKIVHLGSGVLTAFLGKEILDRQKWLPESCPKWFSVVFIVGVVLLVAFGWECFEFSYDLLFGGHMQELTQHGVADTMWDLIVATIGGGVTAGVLVKQGGRRR